MSRTIKADHRLVQPRPEHYVERVRADGAVDKVLVGPYDIKQREKYLKAITSLHMTRHPDHTWEQARRKSFSKWRNLVFATLADELKPTHPNKNIFRKDV